jgi:gas vesicle protein
MGFLAIDSWQFRVIGSVVIAASMLIGAPQAQANDRDCKILKSNVSQAVSDIRLLGSAKAKNSSKTERARVARVLKQRQVIVKQVFARSWKQMQNQELKNAIRQLSQGTNFEVNIAATAKQCGSVWLPLFKAVGDTE